mmetsp:Transcript_20026/g.67823  ORF Transcript_20026/g.67823 Transcript_20026/m.67823 type:complete len:260 (+) Transcript_20026:539-1318(+)
MDALHGPPVRRHRGRGRRFGSAKRRHHEPPRRGRRRGEEAGAARVAGGARGTAPGVRVVCGLPPVPSWGRLRARGGRVAGTRRQAASIRRARRGARRRGARRGDQAHFGVDGGGYCREPAPWRRRASFGCCGCGARHAARRAQALLCKVRRRQVGDAGFDGTLASLCRHERTAQRRRRRGAVRRLRRRRLRRALIPRVLRRHGKVRPAPARGPRRRRDAPAAWLEPHRRRNASAAQREPRRRRASAARREPPLRHGRRR